jgi:phosphonate transport system permease protein
MTSAIRDAALSRRAEIETRYPRLVRPSPHRRAVAGVLVALLAGLAIFGLNRIGFSFTRLLDGFDRLGLVIGLMISPTPGPMLTTYLGGLVETIAIAFLGTLTAAVLGFPLSLLAAKNIIANRVVHFLARRSLDTLRGVETLIWALIFINVVGLGPFAGILAIAISDTGSFGKLFSEAIEASDRKPVEGVRSAGGSTLHGIWFGILPQVFPVLASQVLYYFESNTRSATIIGIVGAGGIGLYLANEIQQAEWPRVAFLILMILVTVAIIDFVSAKLRFAIIGKKRLAY